MVVVLEANDDKAGRFGMTLAQAKDYFLAKAKNHGLTPCNIKENKNSIFISFYHPMMNKPEGWKMPWKALWVLAHDFGAKSEGGDPPWDYLLKIETPLPDPPEGKYMTMRGNILKD